MLAEASGAWRSWRVGELFAEGMAAWCMAPFGPQVPGWRLLRLAEGIEQIIACRLHGGFGGSPGRWLCGIAWGGSLAVDKQHHAAVSDSKSTLHPVRQTGCCFPLGSVTASRGHSTFQLG